MTYSKGPETVPVPAIPSGASEAAVQQAIQKAGLRWVKGADVKPSSKGENPGTFVSSDPASGSKVAAGSVVTYHLAAAVSATPDADPDYHGTVGSQCLLHPALRRTGRTAAPSTPSASSAGATSWVS